MFTYNVARKWFTKQEDANKYRVSLGLKPAAMLVVRVDDREGLAALLNALCEPPAPGRPVPTPATPELVDRAFVSPNVDIPECVPDFLLKAYGLKRE